MDDPNAIKNVQPWREHGVSRVTWFRLLRWTPKDADRIESILRIEGRDFVDKVSLAEVYAALERAADVLGQESRKSVERAGSREPSWAKFLIRRFYKGSAWETDGRAGGSQEGQRGASPSFVSS
jgi:hypothetical protein